MKDKSENMLVRWTYYNKVKSIDSVGFGKRLEFAYDANGDRVVKYDVKGKRKEVYVRDAQGNVVAVYEVKVGNLIDSLFTKEFDIYGTERIGYLEDRNYLGKKIKGKTLNLSPISTMKTLPTLPPSISPLPSIPTFTTFLGGSGSSLVNIYFGKKRYELTDWLGNVRVVISDKKIPDNTGGNIVLNYRPEILSIRDYYAFGSEINERTFEPIKPKYRYGFNNKENDNEIYGNGNAINFGDRIYNSRLGVWWGVDAKYYKYPMMSLYVFAGDNPIIFVDRDGREIVDPQGRRAVEIVEGKITFTEYATEDIKTVVNAMIKTKIGTDLVMNMIVSENKIKIMVEKEKRKYYDPKTNTSGYDKKEGTIELFAETSIDELNGEKMPNVTITVFLKAIEDLKQLDKNKVYYQDKAGKRVYVSDYKMEDIIGAKAVHEATHATDKESNLITNPHGDREENPNKNELKHYEEIDKRNIYDLPK